MSDVRICACGCGLPLAANARSYQKYLNKQHANQSRVAKALPDVLCACGCGNLLPSIRHPTKKFLTQEHADALRRRLKSKVFVERPCGCGCGEIFMPRTSRNKFISAEHRERHHALLKVERIRAEKVKGRVRGKETTTWHVTEDERTRNRESIDRIEGAFLSGDIKAIELKPGAGTLRGRIK